MDTPQTHTPINPTKKPAPAPTKAKISTAMEKPVLLYLCWAIGGGAILAAAMAIFVADAYFPSVMSDLVTSLGLVGTAASFVPLCFVGIIAAAFGAELVALAHVYKITEDNLSFLWNVILTTSALSGAGLALFLAATHPAIFDLAKAAAPGTPGSTPLIIP